MQRPHGIGAAALQEDLRAQATPEVTVGLPTMLRSIADQIEADMMKNGMAEFKKRPGV